MKVLYWSLGIVVLVGVLLGVASATGVLANMCYGPAKTVMSPSQNPIFSPDATEIAFLTYVKTSRPPKGICTFPDGGKPKTTAQKIQIYTASVKGTGPQLVKDLPLHAKFITNGAAVIEWENQVLTFSISYSKTDGTSPVQYYQYNLQTKKLEQIGKSDGEKIAQKWGIYNRYSPGDPTLWTQYTDGQIGLYVGDGFFDPALWGSYKNPENLTPVLVQSIVTPSQFKKLQPGVDPKTIQDEPVKTVRPRGVCTDMPSGFQKVDCLQKKMNPKYEAPTDCSKVPAISQPLCQRWLALK